MSWVAAGSARRWLRAAAVAGVMCLTLLAAAARAGAAPAFSPVSGSPFATGAAPLGVAFSPSSDLLATANANANNVSMFSIDTATGALTPVSGSPFSTGNRPDGVAFSPSGLLLAVANYNAATVSVFSVDAGTGALTPVSGSPFSSALLGYYSSCGRL